MPSLQTKIRVLLFSFSVIMLLSLVYFSDIGKVAEVISGADLYYVSVALVLSLALMLIRTYRWKILLQRIKMHVGFRRLFAVYMSGMMLSNFTPGKIGEPVKSYMLKKTSGLSISKTLPSVFIEKISDIISMILLSLAGISVMALPNNVEALLFPVVIAYLLAIVAVLYISADRKRIYWFSKKMVGLFRWLPLIKRMEKFLEGFAEKFNASIAQYKNAPLLAKNFFLSFCIWIIEGLIVYVCFLSVGMRIDEFAAIALMSISILIGVTSMLPGGLGSSEVVMVLLFTSVYSLPFASVTAVVLMARFFTFWMSMIAGALSMSSLKLNLK
jgi:uncharacterized protein (TIRG00374 family)